MVDSTFRLQYQECLALLRQRLAEPAPGRIQFVSGPRQAEQMPIAKWLAVPAVNWPRFLCGGPAGSP